MRLKSISPINFRGYRAATTIPINEALTGIIGRDDFCMSTILEALAIFLKRMA
ncbi:hypothetical protein V466_11850 [Pseudomonas mandelii PD30]|uniref:Endonuclease GajA/Old nuclease/RecF-like AAA domain-containing protein n=1 Tax=Pseudomonas mandelii PD30 TaxID=1419583 RepID=A0A059L373_9PSED|nr:hypothetical protein V466_11850 [Pseudomonas mandelii PD30]